MKPLILLKKIENMCTFLFVQKIDRIFINWMFMMLLSMEILRRKYICIFLLVFLLVLMAMTLFAKYIIPFMKLNNDRKIGLWNFKIFLVWISPIQGRLHIVHIYSW